MSSQSTLSPQLTPEQAIDRMKVYLIERQAAERVVTLLSPENVPPILSNLD
ncbi:hypothetical protein CROQUDRAFT_96167 [Cronartium quercuum f. sp. fusiforme G11]|uniref:Uncharacterized protein n=1 Tax=Cronartium quercuum f. sp. fusiforme G11 TaxID=708437 RepID=A0A9P6NGG2_9BASI|nr:hypothetical protein CROQUDRAFT_96167 [Cronartium quercuum f. sp. fusiforme G11]